MKFFELYMNHLIKEHKSLPSIGFKNNTSLSMSAQNFIGTGDVHGAKINDTQYIMELVVELEEAFGNRMVNGATLTHIDEIIAALTNVISGSMESITTLKTTVATLADKIKAIKAEKLSRDPYYKANHGTDGTATPSFTELDWTPLITIGTANAIIANVHDKLNIQNPGVTSSSYLGTMGRYVSPSAGKNTTRFVDVDIPKDKMDDIVTIINSSVESVLPDEIRATLKLLTNKKIANRFALNTIKQATNLQLPCNSLMFIMNHLNGTRKVTEAIKQNIIELAPTTDAAIKANIEYMDELFLLMAYAGTHLRNVMFERTLVFPNQMLNPDTLVVFTNQDGTLENIAHHLSFKYPTNELPARGITGEAILGAVKYITDKVTASAGQVKTRLTRLENKATKAAFIEVLTAYLKDVENDDKTTFTHNDPKALIGYSANDAIIKNLSIEDCLYSVMIKLHYQGTFVKTLYTELGSAYLKLVNESSDIEKNDLDIADMTVLVELATEYIMDQFVELV